VLTRFLIVLSLPLGLAACASEAPSLASLAPVSALAVATPPMPAPAAQPAPQHQFRKTMTDRVLAAIALERVTGRKPDPSRLVE